MRKVAVVSAGVSRGEYPQFARFMPLTAPGLHYVIAGLKSDFKVKLVNQTNDGLADQKVIERIDAYKPDVLLFNQFYSTRDRIRKVISSISVSPIMGVGGHDATFHVEETPEDYSMFDFVWRGEADFGLGDLLRNFQVGERPIVINNLESRVQNLDDLPILTHEDYIGDVGFLVTSRGCYPKGCEFCTTPKFYADGRKARGTEHVITELENLIRAGKRYIFITDDNFLGFSTADIERSDKIIAKCKELDLKVMFFSIKEQIMRAFEMNLLEGWQGTVYRIHTGIENADACAARNIGKIGTEADYTSRSATSIKALYKNGIAAFLGYVNFNPNSTLGQLSNSVRFLHEHHGEAADFTHLRQGLRFYPGALHPSHFNLEEVEVREGEFFYEFQDPRVRRLYETLWEIQDEVVGELANRLYGITDLVYINQLQDTEGGRKYWQMKREISTLNYGFFSYCLNQCADEEQISGDKVKDFLEQTRRLERRLETLCNEVSASAKYS